MTAETKGIEIKSRGLLLIGILLLLIGLVDSFYQETHYVSPVGEQPFTPYQSIGIVLVLVGIFFIVLGFFYPLSGTRETRQRKLWIIPRP
jgi:uncharacterized membrane protein HdeD (DUF308 family)